MHLLNLILIIPFNLQIVNGPIDLAMVLTMFLICHVYF